MKPATRVRFRLDFSEHCALGPGKIELLTAIARTGSLSQAARDMSMSYRRAWLLMDSLNKGFTVPVVSASTGGSGGGGARLTALGEQLVDAYLALEKKLNAVVKQQMSDIRQLVRTLPEKQSGSVKARRSIGKSGQSKIKSRRKGKRSVA